MSRALTGALKALNLFFQALWSDIRKSSEVESLQVAVGLSNALRVYWILTYWGHKSPRKELIGLKGTIKRVIRERGFGFISAEDGREIFFHRSAFEGTDFDALEEGNSVEFEVEKGPKGPRAVNVRMIEA